MCIYKCKIYIILFCVIARGWPKNPSLKACKPFHPYDGWKFSPSQWVKNSGLNYRKQPIGPCDYSSAETSNVSHYLE